jgi:hypothetical protein
VSSGNTITRRDLLKNGGASFAAFAASSMLPEPTINPKALLPSKRPEPSARKFQSEAVEAFISDTRRQIGDPELAALFTNCFPNTLDTTVEVGEFEGKPDTAVITGDIPAMWLRDSSAQVWPYLPLAAKDPALRRLL